MLTVPLACFAANTRVTRVSYTQFRRILHAFNARVTLDKVTRNGSDMKFRVILHEIIECV